MFLSLLLSTASSICAQSWDYSYGADGALTIRYPEGYGAPQVLRSPQQQIIAPGESASFLVVVSDKTGVGFQWRFNGSEIPGAIGDTLLLPNVGATNEGYYSVVALNSFGSVTSSPAMLMIDSLGGGMPDSWQLAFFGNFDQNPAGDFDGDGVSNLDEFLEGTDPTDPTSFRPRLNIQTASYGTVFATPSLSSYALGQYVTLTAVPYAGAKFVQWGGAVAGTKNQISLLMNGHKTVSATFALVPAPTVFESVSLAGGSIRLTWSSVSGLSYQLQYSTNLSQAVWSNLGAIVKASGPTATTTDIVGADAQRFYRLNVLP